MATLKRSRSSAVSIASSEAPISWTPCRASAPLCESFTARLRAVCPPSVGSNASGFSRSRMRSAISGRSGST